MGNRKSLNLGGLASKALAKLKTNHECWAYRENTIIQAAILMFSDASKEDIESYLKKIHCNDGRYA